MRKPIAVRIAEAYRHGITYHELFDAVFPDAEYPKARRYQSNGGPPGACMAFGAALRRMNASWRRPGDPVFIGIEEREAAVAQREAGGAGSTADAGDDRGRAQVRDRGHRERLDG